MRKILLVLSVLLGLAAPVQAQDYLTCQRNGVVTVCPGNVRLKAGGTLGAAYVAPLDAGQIGSGTLNSARLPVVPLSKGGLGFDASSGLTNNYVLFVSGGVLTLGSLPLAAVPTLDAAHLPIVTEAKGGFGADISGLGAGYLKRIGAATWTAGNIPAGDIPSGIDAAKIGGGLVTNGVFAYLANVTSDIQSQLNGKQATLTLPLPIAQGGTSSATGDASSLINIPAAQLVGNAPLAAIATALNTGGDPIKGTVLTATTRVETPTIGTNSSNQHALPSGTGAILTADSLPLARANGGTGNNYGGGFDFGTGADGAVTISTTVTLTKSMNYTTLIIANGGVLNTANFAVWAQTSIEIQSGGIIQCNGNDASGSTAGTTPAGKIYISGANGGVGGTTTGSVGTSTTQTAGGAGGAGGAGTSGAGGTGGLLSINLVTFDPGILSMIQALEFGGAYSGNLSRISSGAGGGGGGGNNTNAGGGGGGGAGYVMLMSPSIIVDSGGIVQANGGAGANGTASNTGGGGGGGGGVVALIAWSYTNNGTVQTLGGSKGLSGGGAGVDGTAGGAGNVLTRLLP